MGPNDTIQLRPFEPADRDRVLALLAASLGRADDDPRFDLLFSWKHEQNVFGRSEMLVASDGEVLAGFRAFMRWRFERDGRVVDAVRAVDTATHPEYQGRGVFTRLTMGAVDRLRGEGVGFVFNTPNDQSRPGYLKMGWQEVGRPPIAVRIRSVPAALRMVRSRAPAERWTEPSTVGVAAAEFLPSEKQALGALLASQPTSTRVRTVRSPEYFVWRYGADFLGYRVLVADPSAERGVVIFRTRRRGVARELVLDELLVPDADPRLQDAMVKTLAARADADYIIRIDGRAITADRFVRLPRQGPVLTWRAICDERMPALADWDLTMGDVELF